MFTAYYELMLLISIVLTIILVSKWRKRFDVNLALIFMMVDVSNVGCVLLNLSGNGREALTANKFVYMGGCFLPVLVLFLVIRLCRIHVDKWVKMCMVGLSSFFYMGVLSTGIYPWFYRSVKFSIRRGIVILEKEYTIFHTLFNVMIFCYFAAGIGILIYTYFNKSEVSGKIIQLLIVPFLLCIFGFFLSKFRNGKADLMPLFYDASLIVYLVIMKKISMYDIIDTGIDALAEEGDTGFISLDSKLNYLGSNAAARAVIPDLNKVNVDTCIKDYKLFGDNLINWIDKFNEAEARGTKLDQFKCSNAAGDRIYYVNVSYLYDGKKKCGYQFFFVDNTEELEYSERLQREVKEKTAHIVEMHNTLIMGMATLVESRDNSTGGHIRRTSELVKILVDKMKRDPDCEFELSDEFCAAIIKAAPMHDLGKIAVDDEILRKPGRFEPWEFEKMKMHAAEGARIVREVLEGTDDEYFKVIAENVAHFHHERIDGSGYPEGLKGSAIPLEARIMAIADVYDALVSKRVYKERMSFENADRIIMDGMGTQFDKALEKYYCLARPDFEKFYTEQDAEEGS